MLTTLFNVALLLGICGIHWFAFLVIDHRLLFGKKPVNFSNFIEHDYEWFIYGIAILTNLWSIYYVIS